MDHFESIVATLLEAENYWVRRSYKVHLTKADKKAIGKPSIPRPEIDLLAFDFDENEVIAIEAKSFLDSPGVKLAAIQLDHDTPEGRYKLLTCGRYRNIVLPRLHHQLVDAGMANANTKIRLGLVAGNVYQGKSDQLREHMKQNGWFFWSPEDVKAKVEALAERPYENDPAIITAKILSR